MSSKGDDNQVKSCSQCSAEIVVPVSRSSAGERNARRVVLLDSRVYGIEDGDTKEDLNSFFVCV